MQVEPYAWAQSWQVRHLGADSAIMSFLPGFALLLPMLVLALLPRRPDRPFVNGAKGVDTGGVSIVDDPVVLKRKKLDGRVPEPDEVGAIVTGIFSTSASLTFGALAFGFHHTYRRLLQQADDAAPGRRR